MLRKIAIYKRTGSWMVKDVIQAIKGKLFVVILLSAAQVGAQVCSIGLFLIIVQSLVEGEAKVFKFYNFSIEFSASAGWISLIFVFGISTALLTYFEALYKNKVASLYSLNAMTRVLKIFSQPDPFLSGLLNRERLTNNGKLIKLMMSGNSHITRATLSLLSIFIPIMMLMVATPILMIISWKITLFLPALLFFYVLPYFFLNRHLVRISRNIEENSKEVKLKIKKLILDISQEQYSGISKKNSHNDYLNSDAMQKRILGLQFIRTISNALQGLNFLFLVIFMVIVIIVAKYSSSENTLIELFTYTVVMFQAFAALSKLTSYAVVFNKFLPRIERYAEILQPDQRTQKRSIKFSQNATSFPIFQLAKNQPCVSNSLDKIKLESGMICSVMGSKASTKNRIDIFLNELGGARAFRLKRPFLVFSNMLHSTNKHQDQHIAVRHMLALPENGEGDIPVNITRMLETRCIQQALSMLPQGLDTKFNDHSSDVSPALNFAITIANGLARNAKVIILPFDVWEAIPQTDLSEICMSIKNTAWMVICDNQKQLLHQPYDRMVFSTCDGNVWLAKEPSSEEVIKNHIEYIDNFSRASSQSTQTSDEDDFE